MEQLPTTIDKLIELPTPSDPQISPDGQWVAYTVSTVDWKEDAYVSQIYLVATDGESSPRQLTFTKNGSRSPQWSPDGDYLAFLSKRHDDKGTQIYQIALAGGGAQRLTKLDTSINQIAYAPDGQSIAFSAVPPESASHKKRKETYGDYVEDNVDYQRSHLWVLTLENKKVRQVTAGDDLHVRDFAWHPESKLIAVNAMPSPDMGILLETRIYLLDTQSLDIHPITPKRTFMPTWSPDGTKLLYQRGVYESLEGAFYKNSHFEIVTLADESIERMSMEFDEEIYPQHWTEDGIYFFAWQRTTLRLFRVNEEGTTVDDMIPNNLDGFVGMPYTFSADGHTCAMIYSLPDRYSEIGFLDFQTNQLTTLTDYDQPTQDWALPEHELFTWQSLDGTEIEGIVTKPVDFDPDKQYPLLVIIHGGPTGISTRAKIGRAPRLIYPLYQWAHQGAIILQPNYRGSAGYGEDFRALNVKDLGTGDYADVISGVDALIDEGYVDAERVGAMGWSQGGYISAFITAYSDRFKAVSVGAGISNWMTYYVNTDIHPFTINYLKATPWDDPEIYAKTSPMTYIKNAQTPTLIQHGEKDARVPLPNAFELNQGLLDQGVRSKLVVYPGMPHGPTKPKQSRHIMMDNLNWFNHYIFGLDESSEETALLYLALAPVKDDSTLLNDVANLATRDSAHLRYITKTGDLSDKAQQASSSLESDDFNSLIESLAEQLRTIDSKKIILFSETLEDNRGVLKVLGTLQIAMSRLDDVNLEHRTGDI